MTSSDFKTAPIAVVRGCNGLGRDVGLGPEPRTDVKIPDERTCSDPCRDEHYDTKCARPRGGVRG